MALIKCPECQKEISDTAPSCPNCGYVLSNTSKEDIVKITPTKIQEIQPNKVNGILYITMGVCSIFVGLFLLTIIIGILVIFTGMFLIYLGKSYMHTSKQGVCPHCGATILLSDKDSDVKCHKCKKSSSVDNSYLKPIL